MASRDPAGGEGEPTWTTPPPLGPRWTRRSKDKNFCHVLERNVRERGDKPAMSWKHDDHWHHYTWREVRERVAELAMGLREFGIGKGDAVAIQARNIPDHVVADQGILHATGRAGLVLQHVQPRPDPVHRRSLRGQDRDPRNRSSWNVGRRCARNSPKLEKVVLMHDAEEYTDEDWILSYDDVLELGRAALKGRRDDFEAMWKEVTPRIRSP